MADVSERVPRMPAETWLRLCRAYGRHGSACTWKIPMSGSLWGGLDQLLAALLSGRSEKYRAAQERGGLHQAPVELIGCLYLRISDHMPLSLDIGNTLFAHLRPIRR
jgi:formate C-acetyltransferase